MKKIRLLKFHKYLNDNQSKYKKGFDLKYCDQCLMPVLKDAFPKSEITFDAYRNTSIRKFLGLRKSDFNLIFNGDSTTLEHRNEDCTIYKGSVLNWKCTLRQATNNFNKFLKDNNLI